MTLPSIADLETLHTGIHLTNHIQQVESYMMNTRSDSKEKPMGNEDRIEAILRDHLFESSAIMNDCLVPQVSHVFQSSPRIPNVLYPRRSQNQLKKRSFFTSNSQLTSNYSHSTQGIEIEPMSPRSFNGPYSRGVNKSLDKEDQCYSPMTKEAVALQGLSIQSPASLNSPISSFSSYTPSKVFRSSRFNETSCITQSPACNSPAHRQVPLTIISSSTHDSGVPFSSSLTKTPSRWGGFSDSVTTPVTSKDAEHLYQEPPSSFSSLSTPNRLISPSQRSDMSNFILSPRSSRSSKQQINKTESKDSVAPCLSYDKSIDDNQKQNNKNSSLEESSMATIHSFYSVKRTETSSYLPASTSSPRYSYLDTRADSWPIYEDIETDNNDGMPPPPVQVIALTDTHFMDKASRMSSGETLTMTKSLFNRPSNGSFDKLDSLLNDNCSDSDTQDNLSDDDGDQDNTSFVLGSPEQGVRRDVRKTSTRLVSDASCSQQLSLDDFNCYKQLSSGLTKSFLPHSLNSESNFSDVNSNSDLYGLHVIYEGFPSQGSMDDMYGNMKSKRSRFSLCEELLGMNRAQSNNSMGSLGLTLEEGQGLCHVNSARDLITPPVAPQDRLSPPPIKETSLTLQKDQVE